MKSASKKIKKKNFEILQELEIVEMLHLNLKNALYILQPSSVT